jgi:hypothetical protein
MEHDVVSILLNVKKEKSRDSSFEYWIFPSACDTPTDELHCITKRITLKTITV